MKKALPKTRAFVWKKNRLLLMDQRFLPHRMTWRTCRTWQDVASGIRQMVVRGAPAIGCVAAYGMALAAIKKAPLWTAAKGLTLARPTAVNLKWAVDRLAAMWEDGAPPQALLREAQTIEEADRLANQRMGEFGAELLPPNATVMTICNTGSLATAGLGTAFGVLWTAHRQGKLRKVIVSETRPYLQGARLTAWELKQEKIPFELMTDNMAAHLMKTESVHGIIAGADRIAANGDTANKIGTYALAVLAAHHAIPFYIAAPTSTLDLSTPSGEQIPIEERSADEVTTVQGQRIAPKNIQVRHPAFDVTPGSLITAIITEKGVAHPPYTATLSQWVRPQSAILV